MLRPFRCNDIRRALRRAYRYRESNHRQRLLRVRRFDRHQCRPDLNDLCRMTDSATRPEEEKMNMLPQVLFWLGLICIPFLWLVWYLGPQMEMVRPVLPSISDPALRAALQWEFGSPFGQ